MFCLYNALAWSNFLFVLLLVDKRIRSQSRLTSLICSPFTSELSNRRRLNIMPLLANFVFSCLTTRQFLSGAVNYFEAILNCHPAGENVKTKSYGCPIYFTVYEVRYY